MSQLERFASLIGDDVTLYVHFILYWVALADDEACDNELAIIHRVSKNSFDAQTRHRLFEIAQQAVESDYQIACQRIQNLTNDSGERLLQLAIMVAISDGRLSITENHLLRFLADLLLPEPRQLYVLYEEIAGRAMPTPGDLSSAAYWREQEVGARSRQRNTQDERHSVQPTDDERMTYDKALWHLGLEGRPTIEQIRKAYRRMAQIHHPDRFSSLGEEAMQVAHHQFLGIKAAYEFLMAAV